MRAWPAFALVAGAVAAWFGGPPLLRGLDFFRVRRIEVHGARHMQPDAIASALRLSADASVFDDLEELGTQVQALPGIAAAEVGRRLPGTLEVTISEEAPVAIAPGEGAMRMIGADGDVLPFDPAYSAPDLPVTFAPDSALAGLLARLQAADRALFGQIAAARRRQDHIVLEVGGRRILVMPDASAEEIRAVMAVAQDLARNGRPYAELDGRFAGQVVVRRQAT
jgi:cell division protein FtsQ